MDTSGLGSLLAQIARSRANLALPLPAAPGAARANPLARPGADTPPGQGVPARGSATRPQTAARLEAPTATLAQRAAGGALPAASARLEAGVQAPARLPFAPGQIVQARVVSALPEPGRFVIDVQGRGLDVNLPARTPVGRTLALTFVGAEPRPTFVLHTGQTVRQSAPTVAVSNAARFAGLLVDDAPADGAAAARQSGMRPAAPILPQLPQSTEQLAQGLARVLRHSGLFYEAHQAQWVQGRLPLEALRREPQGQLAPLSPEPARDGEAAHDTPRESRLPGVMSPETRDLVRQQVVTLETRIAVWQGELWPGTAMQWRVEEREAREGRGEREPSWNTQVHVNFPHLGDVRAALSLNGDRVEIRLIAQDEATMQRMRQESPRLAAQLAARGLNLQFLDVAHGDA